MQQLGRTVARNSLLGAGAQITIKVLSFAFTVLIVRNLGAEAFGQYSAALAFGALFLFLADLGMSPYAVRELAHWRDAPDAHDRARQMYGNMLALRGVLGILTACIIVGAAIVTQRPLVMIGAIALCTLGLQMYSIQGTGEAVLGGFERVDLGALAKVLSQLVFVILGGVALYVGLGYYGLIAANLLAIAVTTAYTWRAVRRLGVRPMRPDLGECKRLLPRTLPLAVSGFALGLSYYYDSVLLNITRGDAETGYYTAAYNLVFSALFLATAVTTALYPSLTRAMAADPGRLRSVTERILRLLILIGLPIAVGTSVLADPIMTFLYRDGYAPAIPALRIVIWVLPFMYVSNLLGYVVLIQRRERVGARSVMISSGVNLGLNTVLVPIFGFLAASVMTVLTEVVLVALLAWVLRPLLREVDWGSVLGRPLLAAGAMGLALLVVQSQPLPIAVAVGALVYLIGLLVVRAVGPEDVRMLLRLRHAPAAELSPNHSVASAQSL